MKKISILMLVLAVLFGCQTKQEAVLEKFRSEASDLVVCQVAFIGFSDSEIPDLNALAQEYQIFEYFPFVESYPSNCYLDYMGYEIYLIVAQDKKAQINIYENVMNYKTGEEYRGNLLFSVKNGEPVIIRANVSDIIPNVIVEIINSDGSEFSFSPSLSLRDGSLNTYGMEDEIKDVSFYTYAQ